LKPVVCRRVVGRLTQLLALSLSLLACTKSKNLEPKAKPTTLALEGREWLYLVRSLGFQPEPSSHDWHVQPSCQRTEPLPPERALSVQYRNTHKCISACPRNLYKLRVLRGHCQPIAITGFPPVFHIRGVPKF